MVSRQSLFNPVVRQENTGICSVFSRGIAINAIHSPVSSSKTNAWIYSLEIYGLKKVGIHLVTKSDVFTY